MPSAFALQRTKEKNRRIDLRIALVATIFGVIPIILGYIITKMVVCCIGPEADRYYAQNNMIGGSIMALGIISLIVTWLLYFRESRKSV